MAYYYRQFQVRGRRWLHQTFIILRYEPQTFAYVVHSNNEYKFHFQIHGNQSRRNTVELRAFTD